MIVRIYCENTGQDLTAWETSLAQAFGGFTKYHAKGAYVGETGLVFEDSLVWELVIDAEWDGLAVKTLVHPWAMSLRDYCHQESVLVMVAGAESKLI